MSKFLNLRKSRNGKVWALVMIEISINFLVIAIQMTESVSLMVSLF